MEYSACQTVQAGRRRRRRHQPGRQVHRHALLQPRAHDGAGGDHPPLADQRRDARRREGLAEALGKSLITEKNAPGFVVNRILVPMINEAFFVLAEAWPHPRTSTRV
jgi:hypothetical protein